MHIASEDIPQSDKVEFIVECGCEWKPDYGLEIIVIGDEIVRVGLMKRIWRFGVIDKKLS